jgi:cytochrome c556
MNKALRSAFALPICLAFLSGCTGDIWGEATVPPAGPPGTGPAGSEEATGLKAIMKKIGAGPGALSTVLNGQLSADKPVWETIQPQTKEYAQLAAEMGNYDPSRGSKESWSKLCAEFAAAAAEMDKSAQAKDKRAALAANGQLSRSCSACHREHRGTRQGGPPPR